MASELKSAPAPVPQIDIPPQHLALLIKKGYRFDSFTRLGEGFFHIAYVATDLTGRRRVVKLPKIRKRLGLVNRKKELLNHRLVQVRFPQAAVPGEIVGDGNDTYVAVMDFVQGRPMEPKDVTSRRRRRRGVPQTRLGTQLEEIAAQNAELVRKRKRSLDLVGVEGVWKAFGRHPILPNIQVYEDKSGQRLGIIDEDLLPRKRDKDTTRRAAIQGTGSYLVNRLVVLWRFGVDIGPKRRSR